MVVLDAAALIAVMKDEPAADAVGDVLRERTAMSAVNYCEVVDHLLRIVGVERDWIDMHLAPVIHTSLDIVAVNADIADHAAAVRARFYDAKECAMSLADSLAIATARVLDAPLVTSDPSIARILKHLEHEVIPVPNSRGEYPL